VEFDCAHGTLDQAPGPDGNGHFDVPGTFFREHGGPVRPGEVPDAHPARYAGTIAGSTLTLTVTITDAQQVVGPFKLVRGASARLMKCL
jgi:hypothetical protein